MKSSWFLPLESAATEKRCIFFLFLTTSLILSQIPGVAGPIAAPLTT